MPFRDIVEAATVVVCVLGVAVLCTVVFIGVADYFNVREAARIEDTESRQLFKALNKIPGPAGTYELYGVRVDGKTYWYCDEKWIEIEEPCKAKGDKQ